MNNNPTPKRRWLARLRIRRKLRRLDRSQERIRDRAGYLPRPTSEAFHRDRMALIDQLNELRDA